MILYDLCMNELKRVEENKILNDQTSVATMSSIGLCLPNVGLLAKLAHVDLQLTHRLCDLEFERK